jgi:hypothetical protein
MPEEGDYSMSDTDSLSKQVFVAYAYNLYDKRDYRKVFASLENAYGVKFIFADEKITNMHILQKIISYIKASDFSLFDISAGTRMSHSNLVLLLRTQIIGISVSIQTRRQSMMCRAILKEWIEFNTRVLMS